MRRGWCVAIMRTAGAVPDLLADCSSPLTLLACSHVRRNFPRAIVVCAWAFPTKWAAMKRRHSLARTSIAALFLGLTAAPAANAEEPALNPAPPAATQSGAVTASPKEQVAQNNLPPNVSPPKDPERHGTLEPKAAEPVAPGRVTFDVDPLADSSMIAVSLAFAGTLELINSTGEIRPQQIATGFDSSKLVAIDRPAVDQTPDPKASRYSTFGLGAAVAFAVVDPVLSGYREGSRQTALADAFMYSESISFAFALTNITKMAVRRPRPIAYINARDDPNYSNSSTDSALSFFSGHAAITASVGATATYLAFARSPHTARPWITLVAATALSTFVSVERVRAGAHFPTDVIAGTIVGAGVGVAVPHLHRTDDIKQRRVWVGFAPLNELKGERGAVVNISGFF
jgi:membrane-associated phospholipid phosphatase